MNIAVRIPENFKQTENSVKLNFIPSIMRDGSRSWYYFLELHSFWTLSKTIDSEIFIWDTL